jgi:hypothetical protein
MSQKPDIIDSIECKTIVVDNGIIKDYFITFQSVLIVRGYTKIEVENAFLLIFQFECCEVKKAWQSMSIIFYKLSSHEFSSRFLMNLSYDKYLCIVNMCFVYE